MNQFRFTEFARKKFYDLPSEIRERVKNKLLHMKDHPQIFTVLKRLKGQSTETYRLRIGRFRIILELFKNGGEDHHFVILDCGDRKEIYR